MSVMCRIAPSLPAVVFTIELRLSDTTFQSGVGTFFSPGVAKQPDYPNLQNVRRIAAQVWGGIAIWH
jgi:hypothetical protein